MLSYSGGLCYDQAWGKPWRNMKTETPLFTAPKNHQQQRICGCLKVHLKYASHRNILASSLAASGESKAAAGRSLPFKLQARRLEPIGSLEESTLSHCKSFTQAISSPAASRTGTTAVRERNQNTCTEEMKAYVYIENVHTTSVVLTGSHLVLWLH